MEQIENVRFRSDFYHDLKLQKEFNRGIRDARLFFHLIYLYIIGIFVWMFWYMFIQMDMPEVYSNTALFSCGIWCLVEFVWFLITRNGGVYYKRSLMLNGGKPTHDSVLFCDDHILTLEKESGNKATILYSNIRAVHETENLILLALRYGTYLLVDKRGLSCTKDELGQFLYEKCPKLRHKKVRKSKAGRFLRRIAWAVVAVSFLIALFFHPWLQINKRIQGQIHNGMKLAEISAELESFGLTPLTDADLVTTENGLFYLSNDKLSHLLYCMGAGIRDYDTGDFLPAESGVFFTYYWAEFPDTMYTDLLRGIDAMSRGELAIENIFEDHSCADWANYDGTITVSFDLNGSPHQISAVFYQEWYDEQVLNTLNTMVMEATGKQLWFADFQDTGCFIFLGDTAWAEAFADRTGLVLSSDINDIY